MAILTPSQLQAASNATYFDNTSGSITPTSVRTLNDDWISSSVLATQTGSMSVATASYAATASFLLGTIASASYALQAGNANTADQATFASTAGTANSATTASFALNFNPAATASYAIFAATASVIVGFIDSASFATNAATASYATQFKVATGLTASGLNYPTIDGLEYQTIQTDGAGTLAFDYTKTLYKKISNGEGTSIVKGTPLFVSGSQGDLSVVYRADAGNPARMPATLVAFDNSLASGAEGTAVILGLIENVNTTGYAPGSEVYVGVGGGWTSTRPTGSAEVQPLGVVTRTGANGAGIVLTQVPFDLPNLTNGNTWVGNSNALPVATPVSSLTVATASYVLNAVSSSYASNAELLDNLNFTAFVLTSSFVPFSSSVSTRFGAAPTLAGNNTFTGTNNFNIVSASYIQALSASIDYLSVIYQTSSVVYSSGSNIFGDAASDTQTLWGTVDVVTGPLLVSGSVNVTGSVFVRGSGNSYARIGKDNFTLYAIDAPSTDVYTQVFSSDTATAGQYIGAIKSDFSVDVEHALIATTNSITFNDWDNNAATYVPYLSIAPNTGNNPILQYKRALAITGSAVLKSTITGTEYPFIINQVSDGTSTGGNLISTRNTSFESTGSVIISGSQNLVLLSAGGTIGTGSAAGFTATNSIITQVPFITGSNGTESNRPLPVFTNSVINRGLNITDNRPSTTTTPITVTQSNLNGLIALTTSTGSVSLSNVNLVGANTFLTITGSNGSTKSLNSIGIVGTQNTLLIDSPSAVSTHNGLVIGGNSNTVLTSGSNTVLNSVNLMGYQLRATGSAAATTNYGSLFAGRWNAIDNTAFAANTAFAVGTGAANASRRTSLHVSSSGLTTVRNGMEITGSVNSFVTSASIASNTASLDFSQGNFYTSLVSGSTNFNITNPEPGQTVNVLLTTVGTGASASFSSNVKQVSQSLYTPTATAGAQDILTFISFDGTSVYLASVKNLI